MLKNFANVTGQERKDMLKLFATINYKRCQFNADINDSKGEFTLSACNEELNSLIRDGKFKKFMSQAKKLDADKLIDIKYAKFA